MRRLITVNTCARLRVAYLLFDSMFNFHQRRSHFKVAEKNNENEISANALSVHKLFYVL